MPNVQALVVGQGGSGGGCVGVNPAGGGGGGGGVIFDGAHSVAVQAYTVTVGAGSSVFDTLTAVVGGAGAASSGSNSQNGSNGGSGGGGSGGNGISTGGTGSQGQAGGGNGTSGVASAGGGGAFSSSGQNAVNSQQGGAGAIGFTSSISGASVTYAGGGGGGGGTGSGVKGLGGTGGGGNGGDISSAATSGATNTGGGGGGGAQGIGGGTGGSGVVIIAYPTGTLTATGGTITTAGGNTIHTFTASGTWTVTAILPTVTTQAGTSILNVTAVGNGNITSLGGAANADHRGVVYDTVSHADPGILTPGSSGYASSIDSAGAFSTGAFTENLSSLTANTTYFVRAYAHNSVGYSYGGEISFTTLTLPTTTTQNPNAISNTSVLANGTITSLGNDANCQERGVVYDTVSKALPGNVAPAASGYGGSVNELAGAFAAIPFTETLISLTLGQLYFYRAYSKNTIGYAYGNEVSFSTSVPLGASLLMLL